LVAHKAKIGATLRDKVGMRSQLDLATLFQDDDLVCVMNDAQPVGHDHASGATSAVAGA
jgi:hypothetical protein